MKLQKGMRVFGSIEDISDQIVINSGVHNVHEYNGLTYFKDAYVPLQTWRSLTDAESRLLVAKRAKFSDHSKSVYVGEIPEKLKEVFQPLDLKSCTIPNEVLPKFHDNKKIVKKINKELHAFLKDLSSTGNFKFHRVTRAIANKETISYHLMGETQTHIGLHIDQSRRFKIHTAYKSGNRISINLSEETRTLIFTNLTLIQIYNLLSQKIDLSKIDLNPDNIAELFYIHYPDYPVVKVAIKPYQYYVAPTDNFFHDASTVGNKEIDVTIVYTGLFDQLP